MVIQLNLFNLPIAEDTKQDNLTTKQDNPNSIDHKIFKLIKKRRWQILIHSVIYYRMNDSLISDHQFDKWSYELVDLQNQYPKISEQVELYDSFKDFDGTTGYDLPLNNPKAVGIANQLLMFNNKKGDREDVF